MLISNIAGMYVIFTSVQLLLPLIAHLVSLCCVTVVNQRLKLLTVKLADRVGVVAGLGWSCVFVNKTRSSGSMVRSLDAVTAHILHYSLLSMCILLIAILHKLQL